MTYMYFKCFVNKIHIQVGNNNGISPYNFHVKRENQSQQVKVDLIFIFLNVHVCVRHSDSDLHVHVLFIPPM